MFGYLYYMRNKDEKLAKLKRLKEHQDLEFAELGVDDGL